ncbi:thiaminase II [Alkalicoccobacillus murimartini]|uniref:Aminopyrimidine aminohydrolase n=1 Tax=Alkalicoccobacillus murimartini TaxID=171685 RepID=A0ABT9YE44_9BACI|nr:thiaminase II [Alkalicoccobacillus murimartini]MDQ0206105.1 thiaminase/transcriptional activator TenA [Alkalicoccobacillus murimartini]
MTFTSFIRNEADSIWRKSFDHPFIRGIADGSLPLSRFKYYVMQDSYYLSHFARVQSLAAAKAVDPETTNRLAIHAQSSYEAEMALHREFSGRLGITSKDKEQFKPAPTAYAYTSHLYRAAYNGYTGDAIAALLPCYWLYYEIGEKLQGYAPTEPIYRDWIQAYGGDEFKELTFEQIHRLDRIAEQSTVAQREQMLEHFMISSRYELNFWEMAYTSEKWTDLKESQNIVDTSEKHG